jgi:CDP-diacylglycerol--glycerol-3-phosphate 3-phosphatidyltransferase
MQHFVAGLCYDTVLSGPSCRAWWCCKTPLRNEQTGLYLLHCIDNCLFKHASDRDIDLHKGLFYRFIHWLGDDLGITPNQITWGRLVIFIPGWCMWFFRHELAGWSGLPWELFGYLALIVVTTVIIFDLVDGALARETGQVSDHGRVVDPLVDKFITYSTLLLFWATIDRIGLGILFVLDIASTFLRGVAVSGANQFGKKKAFSQNISKFFFGMAVLTATPWLATVGNFLIWTAVVLASISVAIRVLPSAARD